MARVPLRQRIQGIWQKLSRLDARPGQLAAGFSIGIAASFLPLNPSPIVVATAIAWLLRMNMIAAVAGGAMAILYTPLLPLIWFAEYRLGTLIFPTHHPLTLDHARLSDILQMGWQVYIAMLIGSTIVGIPVTSVTYFFVKKLAEKWARRKNKSLPSN